MLRAGIITKLYKRPALTGLFLQHYASLAESPALRTAGVELVLVAAISPQEDPGAHRYATGDYAPWHFVGAPNRPLSEKGNVACRALEGMVDLVVNVGSDDFLSADYIARAAQLVAAGHDYLCPQEIYYLDAPTLRAVYAWGCGGLGAGRVLSARLLDRVGWAPWAKGEHPDVDMNERLGRAGARTYWLTVHPGAIVDVKSREGNISTFEEMAVGLRRRHADGHHLLSEHFPDLLDGLLATGLAGVPV